MRRDIEDLLERAKAVATSGTGKDLLRLVGELREVSELSGQVRQLESELEVLITRGAQSAAQLDRARQRRDDARAALDRKLAHLGVRGQAALPGIEVR